MDPFPLETIANALVGAVLDRSQWPTALEAVARCTNSHGAVVLPVIGKMPFVCATPSLEKSFDLYVQGGWVHRDLRYLGTPKLLENGVTTDDDCLPAEERKRSPFYQDFLAKCDLDAYAGVRMGRGDHVWNLSIQRSATQEPFSTRELSSLARLSDSLDSITEIANALGLERGVSALDAFQFSHRAALLLNRDGEIVRVNATAEQMLGSDLTVSRGRIHSIDPKATEILNRSIRALLWNSAAPVVPPVIFPKVGGGKLVIYPMRLPGLTDSPLSAFHAILVVADTDAPRALHAATLRAAFDLTAAEARLATAVADGQDIASFAAAARLSKETVRNQLKAVFAKTGTGRQSELTAMLATLISGR